MKHNNLDDNIKRVIVELEKKGRKEKKDYLLALANNLDTSKRRRISINIFKLDNLAVKNKDKIFLVAGKVLGFGSINNKLKVYAYSFSENAKKKIESLNGELKSFEALLKDKIEAKDVLIVK
jgi:large subunit ribosomal protein L18e